MTTELKVKAKLRVHLEQEIHTTPSFLSVKWKGFCISCLLIILMTGPLQPRDSREIAVRPRWPLINDCMTMGKVHSSPFGLHCHEYKNETKKHRPFLPSHPFLHQPEQLHFDLYHILQFRIKFHFLQKVLMFKKWLKKKLDGLFLIVFLSNML